MTYAELMERVLAGKSVNARAKELGIPQKTLEGYVKERSFPGCAMTKTFATAAGVSIAEAVEAVADRESQVRPRSAFSIPQFGAVAAAVLIGVTNFLTPPDAQAAPSLASHALYEAGTLYYVKLTSEK